MNLKEARAAAYEAGFRPDSHDASDRDQQQLVDGNWRVCFQTATPREGRRTSLDFGVVRLEAPCPPQDGAPVPWPRMPKVVGMTFEKASAAIRPTGITRIEADSAYTDVPPPSDPDAWKVCFQNPEANDPIENPAHETARLKLVAPGTRCPADAYTRLHDDNDDARHHGTSTSGGSGSSAGGGGGQAGLQYGRFCSPVGARGITTDGRPAKCFMGKDGRARWGYGS